MSSIASDFNNVGICAAAIMSVLRHAKVLSPAKVLLVMPLVMHEGTMRYLSDGRTAPKEIAALITARPELFANFPGRFNSSLATSLNAIQLLADKHFIKLNRDIHLLHALNVDKSFGGRAIRVESAAHNIASALSSPVEELYLNLRIPL